MRYEDAGERVVRDLTDLSGRVALVTGAGGHLGPFFARALARNGAKVLMTDKSNGCLAACDEINLSQGEDMARARPFDLAEDDQVVALAAWAREQWGQVDILVNNAALTGQAGLPGWSVPFDKQSPDSWRICWIVNLHSYVLLAQLLAGDLGHANNGVIVNVASINGLTGPDPKLYGGTNIFAPAAYSLAKAGCIHLSTYLACALGPAVRANSLTPGGIWRRQDAKFVERYEQRVPLRRMATEADYIGPLIFLCSDQSAYMTGHNLVVDGGYTAW